MERRDGMTKARVNWVKRSWDAVSHMMQSPGIFIPQHKNKGKVPSVKQQIFRGKLFGVSQGHKHLPQGYEEALSTSCSLLYVFLRISHLSDPSIRVKAAVGQQRLTASLAPSLHPLLYPSSLLFPELHYSWCCQVTAQGA